MKIALVKTDSKKFFTKGIERALSSRGINFEFIDIAASNVVPIVQSFDGLMWHFSHADARDYIMAKPLLSSLESSGFPVFPCNRDYWHFDDKLAQKYLFEALDIPTPKTEVFYSAKSALDWLSSQDQTVVMKLRSGASSANVRVLRNNFWGTILTTRCFWPGFRQFNRIGMARDAVKKARLMDRNSILSALKECGKIFVRSPYEVLRGRERGYVLLQEFLTGNDHDIRIVVIGKRAFGMRRFNRRGDFRASGSGIIDYDVTSISKEFVMLAFEVARKLQSQIVALDFITTRHGEPRVVEVSYGVDASAYRHCRGFWDSELVWHASSWLPGEFYFEDFIVEDFLEKIKRIEKGEIAKGNSKDVRRTD